MEFIFLQTDTLDADVFLTGVVGALGLFGLISAYYYIKLRHFKHYYFIKRFIKIRKKYKKVLEEKFDYYKNLCPSDKIRFEKRVQYIISSKAFIPRDKKPVTTEMKALIAASIVQLTFGFPGLHLTHFKKIIIYPEDYYSRLNRTFHKGEVNPGRGIIVLSWNHFKKGYSEKDSFKNLGLHEMAHALRLENNIFNEEYNFLDESIMEKWEKYCNVEVRKIRKGEESFFRRYAGTNTEEFFAVAVENFFERPQEFSEIHPDFYQIMVALLQQDPLALNNPNGESVLRRK